MTNKTRETGNLTSNGILSVDLANNRIGVGSTQPQQSVDVNGTIRATTFVNSDGSPIGGGNTANVETNTLRVIGVSTFQNNIDVTGHTEIDNLNVSGVSTFQSHVYLGDNDSLYLGADQDLSIYHDGTSGISWIQETGAGDLRLATNSSVVIQNTTGTAKTSAEFNPDGAAELYYNNFKKFETTGIGVSISNGGTDTATIAGPENLILDPAAVGDNTGIVRIKGDLYVDGTEFKVDSSTINLADLKVGIATNVSTSLLLDGGGIGIGDPDVAGLEKTLLWNHTNSRMEFNADLYAPNFATGNINLENLYVSGLSTFVGVTTNQSTLFANQLSVAGVSTFASNVEVNGNITLGDGDKVNLSTDFEMYSTGLDVYLRTPNSEDVYIANVNNTMAKFVASDFGKVELYYNNFKKFETTNTGAIVTGILTATSFSGNGANVTNVNAANLGGSPLTALQKNNADTDLVMNNQSLHFGASNTNSKIRWSGTANLWDLISGDLLFRDNTTTRFTFARTSGDFTALGNVTAYSDITFKKNIELIPNALDKVLNLRGVTYNRTDIENEPKQSGVIAQEVEEVLPEVVNTNDEGIKSVAYGNMVGLLIEAIKEQQTTIENLTKRIEILEGGN